MKNKAENKPKRKAKSFIVGVVTFLLLSALACLFLMPTINPTSFSFWFLLAIVAAISGASSFFAEDSDRFPVMSKIFLGIVSVSILILIVGTIFSFKIFHAQRYANLLSVEPADIADYNITLQDVPLLDKDSAFLLANRKMGVLVDLVSQFSLDEYENTQINYNGTPSRVLPLQYSGFFKYWNNRAEGIPGYVKVDMATQKAEMCNVDGGIHYSPSAYFFKNLQFHVYWYDPTAMTDSYTFDVDDDGHPYWVVRIVKHTIGLFSGTDMRAVLLVDAVTGDIQKYALADVPAWVDTVYPADMIISQYDLHGTLHNGFWNSKIGQKEVVKTTSGYNYITYDGDVYLYTGITSVVSDESNIGFIFTNLRTKETKQFTLPSAEEFSAMESAEGQVQHLSYDATFPILVKVAGQPTYCMTLKDAGGLVKLYAMVNAENYQVVVTGASINETMDNYVKALASNNIAHESADYVAETTETGDTQAVATETATGVILEIRSANMDGTTYYYLQLQGISGRFEIPATDKDVIFANLGDTATVQYDVANVDQSIISATLVSLQSSPVATTPTATEQIPA